MASLVAEASPSIPLDALTLEKCTTAGCTAPWDVLSLGLRLSISSGQMEPLCDPLTLERFLNARNGDVEAAAKMWESTVAWRKSANLAAAMEKYGEAGQERHYTSDGTRKTSASEWTWRRSPNKNSDCELIQRLGFWGRLPDPASTDGDVIVVWRLGACDIKGLKREEMLDLIGDAFACHLEDLLQAGRAASIAKRKMIRARLIVDLDGVGLGLLPLIPTVKKVRACKRRSMYNITSLLSNLTST